MLVDRIAPIPRPAVLVADQRLERPAVRHPLDAELAVQLRSPRVVVGVVAAEALVLPRAVDVRAVAERGGRQPRALGVELAHDLTNLRDNRRRFVDG